MSTLSLYSSIGRTLAATGYHYAHVLLGSHFLHWDDGLLALLSAGLKSPDLYALCRWDRGGPMPVSSLPSFLCLSLGP